ncbi:MAG: hypothetical protein ACYDGN_14830 [Acidimicrobiales bacterium]
MGALNKLIGMRAPVVVAPGTGHSSIEQLDLVDITLVSDVDGSAREVQGLGLHFDADGLSVRSKGTPVVQIPWTSLKRLQTTVRPVKGAPPRVELGVESDRKRHRFVVPNVDPDVLKGSLGSISRQYADAGLVGGNQPRSRRLR